MNKGAHRSSARVRASLSNASRLGEKSSRGDKVYYRLLTYDAPYNSLYPIDSEDDSLSFLHAARIPPPGLAADYIRRICSREAIHYSRANLYISSPSRRSVYAHYTHSPYGRTTLHDDPAFRRATPDAPLRLRAGGCGSSRANPLVLYLDLDPSVDRTEAAFPVSRLEREGRRVAKVVRMTIGVVQSFFLVCFGSLQRVPKGMH